MDTWNSNFETKCPPSGGCRHRVEPPSTHKRRDEFTPAPERATNRGFNVFTVNKRRNKKKWHSLAKFSRYRLVTGATAVNSGEPGIRVDPWGRAVGTLRENSGPEKQLCLSASGRE